MEGYLGVDPAVLSAIVGAEEEGPQEVPVEGVYLIMEDRPWNVQQGVTHQEVPECRKCARVAMGGTARCGDSLNCIM